jgi:hypothetical protein
MLMQINEVARSEFLSGAVLMASSIRFIKWLFNRQIDECHKAAGLSFINLKVHAYLPDKNGRFRYKDGRYYYFSAALIPGTIA